MKHLDRRSFLMAAAGAAAAPLVGVPVRPPNVVFIYCDDLG